MIIAGIDPGKSGGLALHNPGNGVLWVHPVPLVGDTVNEPEWAGTWGNELRYADHIFIEKVGAMPGQGVTSMFNFGKVYGFVIALAAASGRPYSFVTPQVWRKTVGLPNGAPKGSSRARASQLFPNEAHFWKLAKHDGLAEAALIAYHGALTLRGKE